MPRIINYLDRVRPVRSYDEEELARLQIVYDRACKALEIEPHDARRETIAGLIFHLADEIANADGSADADEFANRVVALFRNAA